MEYNLRTNCKNPIERYIVGMPAEQLVENKTQHALSIESMMGTLHTESG